jgi:hypothetical protein
MYSLGFSHPMRMAFGADGEWAVSAARRLWFRNGGRGIRKATRAVNRKFTATRRSRDFSAKSRRIKLNAMTGDLSRSAT